MRRALLAGERLLGLFTRLRDPAAVETLAAAGLDFVVLDTEHGSMGRDDVDRIVLAARAGALPVLVRLPDATPAGVQHAMTVGASGVIVPHITSGEEARAMAAFARGEAVQRAYAGVGRLSANRRRAWTDFRAEMEERFVVIAQIDEPEGVAAAADIAAAPGIDAVFLGTLSLALALDAKGAQTPAVEQSMARVCDACRAAGRRVGMHLRDPQALASWTRRGVTLLVLGNDHGLLLEGAEKALAAFRP